MKTNKLVRDRIPDIIRENGETPVVQVLTGEALDAALVAKLDEECAEFRAAAPEDRPEELADILEVLFALGERLGVDEQALMVLRREKRLRRGGFAEGYYLAGTQE